MTHLPDMTSFAQVAGRSAGAVLLYHQDRVNQCPGCAGTHWLVGRISAQCAGCETALPLAKLPEPRRGPLFFIRSSSTACHV